MATSPLLLILSLVSAAVALIAMTMAAFRKQRSVSVYAAGFVSGALGFMLATGQGRITPWISVGLPVMLVLFFGICLAWGLRTWMRLPHPWTWRFAVYLVLLALVQVFFLRNFVLRSACGSIVGIFVVGEFLAAMRAGKRVIAPLIRGAVWFVGIACMLGNLTRLTILLTSPARPSSFADLNLYNIYFGCTLAVFFVLWGGVVSGIEIAGLLEEVDDKGRILKNLATTDELTGLANRRLLDSMIAVEMARASRYREHLSLILFDLDHFKRVNDTCGHAVGDEVLVRMAEVIRGVVRAADAIFRWGGEEFMILVPHTDQEGALALAEKLRAAFAAESHPVAGTVTASFGVAEWQVGEQLSEWFKRVDRALYVAKNGGRNRVAKMDPEGCLPRELVSLDWLSDFISGNPLIDEQHRQLVELANQALTLSESEASRDEIKDYLEFLLEHIERHFADEEGALSAAGYPDLISHIKCHRNLVKEAVILKKRFLANGVPAVKIFDFLVAQVVVGHMQTEDTKFFPWTRH
jgi:diguanylate cyclase (GGDEF)-like protein/hemerythrin-like metal-binding protein